MFVYYAISCYSLSHGDVVVLLPFFFHMGFLPLTLTFRRKGGGGYFCAPVQTVSDRT